MFTRTRTKSITQWMIASTASVTVLALSGLALAGSATPSSDDFSMGKRWQKGTDLIDKKVVNAANENLGKLDDIVVDPNSGRILYGVLSFGGFLEMGDKLFAIPWQSLELSGDGKAFTLNVEKDRLKAAPGFEKAHWPNFADEQWAASTYKYYNVTPYWNSQADNAAGDYRKRWNQRTTAWQKCSDLHGKDAVDAQKQDIGELSDLVIDPDGDRILYGVLSYDDKLFAVPWSAVTLPSDAKTFVLNVNKDQLKDSASFGKNNWPNFTDQRWATETHTYYRVQPYWTTSVVENQIDKK